MMFDTAETLVHDNQQSGDFENFKYDLIRIFSIDSPFDSEKFLREKAETLTQELYNKVWDGYQRKNEKIASQAYPVIKDVYENQAALYENIVIPISDGQRIFSINTSLKKAYETSGIELSRSFEKNMMLITIDEAWKEHLRELDDLKQAVQNASYEQKDPLLIYKFESFNLFKTMIDRNNKSVVSTLAKAHIPIRDVSQVRRGDKHSRTDLSNLRASKDDPNSGDANKQKGDQMINMRPVQPVRVEKKIGRNELCPCGSGKKYKQCHGK
jgi:preprotein translocase subunit SecA